MPMSSRASSGYWSQLPPNLRGRLSAAATRRTTAGVPSSSTVLTRLRSSGESHGETMLQMWTKSGGALAHVIEPTNSG